MSDYDVQRARAVHERNGIPQLGGIRLVSVGPHGLEVHVEVNGMWRLAIREHHDCSGCTISHVVETDGRKPNQWPEVTEARAAEELDWDRAGEKLQNLGRAYASIGPPGMFGAGVVAAALVRFDRGERTPELFAEIESLE